MCVCVRVFVQFHCIAQHIFSFQCFQLSHLLCGFSTLATPAAFIARRAYGLARSFGAARAGDDGISKDPREDAWIARLAGDRRQSETSCCTQVWILYGLQEWCRYGKF